MHYQQVVTVVITIKDKKLILKKRYVKIRNYFNIADCPALAEYLFTFYLKGNNSIYNVNSLQT